MKISEFLKSTVGVCRFNSICIDKITNKIFLPTLDTQQFQKKLIEFYDNQEFKEEELENMMMMTYFHPASTYFHYDISTSSTMLSSRGMAAHDVFDLSKIDQNLGNEEWSLLPRTIALRLGSLQHTFVRYGLDTPFVKVIEDGLDIRYKSHESAMKLLRTLQQTKNMTMEHTLRNGTESDPYCVFIQRDDLPVFLDMMKFPEEKISEFLKSICIEIGRKANKENSF